MYLFARSLVSEWILRVLIATVVELRDNFM